MPSANAADLKNGPVVRVLHVVDVPNCLGFAHFTLGRRLAKVFNVDADPSFVWNTGR
jgi:hypothetical protein